MPTIKSYTDLEQSKKLAEILPLESADICHVCGNTTLVSPTKYGDTSIEELYKKHIIPAWSLAALLGVLPKIHGLKPILDLEECSIQYSGIDLYIVASNPVDACYEMIEKLHELNLL